MEDRCGFLGDGTSTYGGITGISKLLIDGNHTAGAITAATGVDTYAEITITDISTMLGKVRADAIPGARHVEPAPLQVAAARHRRWRARVLEGRR